MPHRYFASEFTESTAALTGPDAHHLGKVMRARPGDEVILCDGAGFDYTAAVAAVTPDRVEFRLLEKRPSEAEPSVEVTLFAGYPKQDKLEFIVQKAVELGAARIVPFFSRFCVAAPKKEDQKNARYARIAAEAAKQAGRGVIPLRPHRRRGGKAGGPGRHPGGGTASGHQRPARPLLGVRFGALFLRGGRREPAHPGKKPEAHRPHHRGGRGLFRRGDAAFVAERTAPSFVTNLTEIFVQEYM